MVDKITACLFLTIREFIKRAFIFYCCISGLLMYRIKMITQVVVALLLVGASFGGPLSRKETAKPRADDTNYRLPPDVKPIKYTVRLIPDIENEKFSGSVEIEIKMIESSNSITLHNRKLTIPQENIKVKVKDGDTEIEVLNLEEGSETDQEFFIINLKETLEKDKDYVLHISEFTGDLNNEYQGFYLAKYTDENGDLKKFATTQFEPTAARRAFPCFDEPALKAQFQIFLTAPEGFTAFSNTPIIDTKTIEETGQTVNEFEVTEEMSTYLLAFIVSQMQYSPKDNHGVLAKPQAINDKTEQYALNTGIEILKAIEKFVDIPYSLAKMDQAAIPDKYFSAGAMENWGLVTYRETYLLKSDKSTTTSMHQTIATIIAHEFGHQWFGNLVSPQWWEYLWLNEGFATYFEYLGASLVETTWRIMEQFVVKNTQYAFGPDSLDTTRAMNHDAGSPNEISALFDRVAYEKSGSVIRMMEAFLTTEVLKKGLKYYLTEKGKNTAAPSDLYNNLQKAADEDQLNLPKKLSEIMGTWDSQHGYPVIDVVRRYTTTEQENVFLNQSRFLLKSATSEHENFWIVPLNFATKNKAQFESTSAEQWLTEKEADITVEGLRSEDWLIINKQETGYYRVNYDEINWRLLIDALADNLDNIHLLNRAQLIDDSFNLARSERLSYAIPFQLSSYLSKEVDYIPFYSFFTAATFLNNMLSASPTHSHFKVHVITVLDGVHKHLGFDEGKDDTHLDKLNRINVVNWLCNLGDSECRTTTLNKFRTWKNDESSSIPLNLQAPVFCGAMRNANQEEWDFLYSKYKEIVDSEDDGALRSRILSALGCSENTEILEYFLNNATGDGSIIIPEDAFAAVYNSGSIGVTVGFEYVSKHFELLYTKLQNRLTTVLNGIGAKLTTEEQLTRLKELSEKHDQQKDSFKTAIINAEENVNWNDKHLLEITNWLNKYSSGGNVLHPYSAIFAIILNYFLLKIIN